MLSFHFGRPPSSSPRPLLIRSTPSPERFHHCIQILDHNDAGRWRPPNEHERAIVRRDVIIRVRCCAWQIIHRKETLPRYDFERWRCLHRELHQLRRGSRFPVEERFAVVTPQRFRSTLVRYLNVVSRSVYTADENFQSTRLRRRERHPFTI